MYSSSMFRFGFRPKIGEPGFSLEMPSGVRKGCTFAGVGAFGETQLGVVLSHGIRKYKYKSNLTFLK